MNRIKRILRMQGRSQAFLCRTMDKSANTLSLWCNNKVQPSVQDLYRIAELLDCEVADLLVEKDQIINKK
ncbi:MAG: helix-turn-helix domain-containing protein [Crocinitomicaceae bacterium]|nr:helix-turn-helix domain-containing protein [Crocinitomicaceae bacterium]